jgi:hypothetical protein
MRGGIAMARHSCEMTVHKLCPVCRRIVLCWPNEQIMPRKKFRCVACRARARREADPNPVEPDPDDGPRCELSPEEDARRLEIREKTMGVMA